MNPDGPGGAGRLQVQHVVADNQQLGDGDTQAAGGLQDAVRGWFGGHGVIAGDDDLEVGGGEPGEVV